MSYYLQGYGDGFIARDGDKYEYNVNGEVAGTYDSIDKLVEANPTSDGKSNTSGQRSASEADSSDVAATGTVKAPQKATRRKSTK